MNPKEAMAGRRILTPIVYLVPSSQALPTDYKAASVNTFLAAGTRVQVLTGTDGVNPSPITSDLTTEGKQVTQALDISGTPTLLGLDPDAYNTLRTSFHNQDLRVVKIFVDDIDTQLDTSTGVTTAAENDVIEIGHIVDFAMFLNNVSQQEMQATTNYARQVDGDDDSIAIIATVLADA